MRKIYQLRFAARNKDIFEAIQTGKKRVETRAASKRYAGIKDGDILELSCVKEKLKKTVRKARIFKSIGALLRVYQAGEINPNATTKKELMAMYASFPQYREKIAKFGLIAMELE